MARDQGGDREREACRRVEPRLNPNELNGAEVRGVAVSNSMFGSGALKSGHWRQDDSTRVFAARGGGSMLYGISAALNQMHFSDDSVSVISSSVNSSVHSIQFLTHAPDRPSSMR